MTQCCCGTRSCPTYIQLQDSSRKLHELQEQNSLAGEFGQALLARHENYVAEAEKERRRMMEKISSLEQHNTELEATNKRTIQENRDLLDKLEALNGAVKDSDGKLQSLSEVLSSTEYELERMTGLAARTEELHLQMTQLEEELAAANSIVTVTAEENRATNTRWQHAEKTIVSLQAEIERIEGDAKVERERHAEVLQRMDKRRAVETELRKNRPWKHLNESAKDGNGVVSHFVKDILQDNANLQLGIVELREMLQRSNNEIESLRDDLIRPTSSHEPIDREGAQTPSLSSELEGTREVHVHHHYHAPNRAAEARKPRAHVARRKGKQRGSGHNTPRSSISAGAQLPSSTSAILSNTSVTIPQRGANRWSTQSGMTTGSSSLPGSPYSDSIFDRAFQDAATDVSRPSTPDSLVLSPRTSHAFVKFDINRSDVSYDMSEPPRSVPQEDVSRLVAVSNPGHSDFAAPILSSDHPVIPEENEDLESSQHMPSSPPKPFALDYQPMSPIRPMRRRANSHESLVSIHGMDIHTLRTRPSQLLLGQYISAAPPTASSEVTVSDTSAFATRAAVPARLPQQRTTSQTYLSGIAAAQKGREAPSRDSKNTLKGKVGGWVWGRWGAKPALSTTTTSSSLRSTSQGPTTPTTPSTISEDDVTPTASAVLPHAQAVPTQHNPRLLLQPKPIRPSLAEPRLSQSPPTPRKMFLRPPGVNQAGPIFGFPPERRLSPTPVMKKFDAGALKDVLDD